MLVAGDSAGLMRIFGNVDVTLAKKKKKSFQLNMSLW